METISNELKYRAMVAEFMGFEHQTEEWCGSNIRVESDFDESGFTMVSYEPDKNWYQLMPVFDTIVSFGYHYKMTENDCYIYGNGIANSPSWNVTADTNIEAAFTCALQFITWYTVPANHN